MLSQHAAGQLPALLAMAGICRQEVNAHLCRKVQAGEQTSSCLWITDLCKMHALAWLAVLATQHLQTASAITHYSLAWRAVVL